MTDKELLQIATAARENSYAPYSRFKVGAALLAKSGKVYTGANIENAGYTPTVCAERVAFFTAVHQGERGFLKIAIVGAKDGEPAGFCAPCGVCRQVMSEFCNDDFQIILGTADKTTVYTLKEILPERFGPNNLA